MGGALAANGGGEGAGVPAAVLVAPAPPPAQSNAYQVAGADGPRTMRKEKEENKSIEDGEMRQAGIKPALRRIKIYCCGRQEWGNRRMKEYLGG